MKTEPIHVWLIPSIEPLKAEEDEALRYFISPPERARAYRMTNTERRREFLLGHALSRLMAGHLLGKNPSLVPLFFEERQKPQIAWSSRRLSLTHTSQMVAVAMAPYPVGIDIERIGSVTNRSQVAESHFAPEEADELKRLLPQDEELFFTQVWALREAFYKAAPLTWREVRAFARFQTTSQGEIVFVPKGLRETHPWKFAWTPLSDNHILALSAQPVSPLHHGVQVLADERSVQYGDSSQERGVITSLDFPPVDMQTLSQQDLVEAVKGGTMDLHPFAELDAEDPSSRKGDLLEMEEIEEDPFAGMPVEDIIFLEALNPRGYLPLTSPLENNIAGRISTGVPLHVIRR